MRSVPITNKVVILCNNVFLILLWEGGSGRYNWTVMTVATPKYCYCLTNKSLNNAASFCQTVSFSLLSLTVV